MTTSHEAPTIRPNDPELNERAAEALGPDYTVGEGQVIDENGQNINPHFNEGVPHGPWVAPGSGRSREGLSQDAADAAAEDLEKSRRIVVNAYPMGPISKSKVTYDALASQVKSRPR